MGPKTLPMIWGTYMKLVTKYQISAINSCWEKCDEKWAYMFNVYKNQQSRQTGSRNLMGPKTLPTIWYTYMTLVLPSTVTEKNATKNILKYRFSLEYILIKCKYMYTCLQTNNTSSEKYLNINIKLLLKTYYIRFKYIKRYLVAIENIM
jgi:hypothetical protein